jgi:hypothetical protein
MAGIEPATFGVRRNPRLHHRRSLCKYPVTCRHSIRAFFSPLERLHLQGKKQALKFSHRFRGSRGFYKFPRRGFRRLREEPLIELYLGDRSLFPGKACSQFFPDAEVLGPVFQHSSRGRIRTCVSRSSGEVTVVFATGQTQRFKNLPGNHREEPTRGTIFPGTLCFGTTPPSLEL